MYVISVVGVKTSSVSVQPEELAGEFEIVEPASARESERNAIVCKVWDAHISVCRANVTVANLARPPRVRALADDLGGFDCL